MDRLYYLNHSPIEIYFKKNSDNFVVHEIPLYEFSGEGEHLVLHVRKKDLATVDLLQILSDQLGIKKRDIGYAGLKDKEALSTQYISINAKDEHLLSKLNHPNIKILSTTRHNNKIKVGHLKGNKFFIRFKKVNEVNAKKLENVFKTIVECGIPNYFGYQRFGKDKANFEKAKELINSKKKVSNKFEHEFLLNAYQSHLFNLWLSKRIEISKIVESFSVSEISNFLNINVELAKKLKSTKTFFKMLPGDVANHYPYGRFFVVNDIESESERFLNRQLCPTGLLCGKKAMHSVDIAWSYEKDFIENVPLDGHRRYAWVFLENSDYKYNDQNGWFEFSFSLPKGCYATTVIEELTKKEIIDGEIAPKGIS